MKVPFHEAAGATLAALAMVAILYAIVAMHSDTALGLAGGVVVAANGYFLRAKVQQPEPPPTRHPPDPAPTASLPIIRPGDPV